MVPDKAGLHSLVVWYSQYSPIIGFTLAKFRPCTANCTYDLDLQQDKIDFFLNFNWIKYKGTNSSLAIFHMDRMDDIGVRALSFISQNNC